MPGIDHNVEIHFLLYHHFLLVPLASSFIIVLWYLSFYGFLIYLFELMFESLFNFNIMTSILRGT